MSPKVDFKKTLKNLYNPKIGVIHVIDVPEMRFLKVDGIGNPNTSEDYKHAVEALYTMSYGLKFAYKAKGYDHVVPPLEGLWWMDDMSKFTLANKDSWKWTMMIMQPDWVSAEYVDIVREDAFRKKKLKKLHNIRFEPYEEGLAVQVLYIGAYDNEVSTIAEMHRYIHDNGYQTNGKHHEIYLSDPNKVASDKLLTILRQPISK